MLLAVSGGIKPVLLRVRQSWNTSGQAAGTLCPNIKMTTGDFSFRQCVPNNLRFSKVLLEFLCTFFVYTAQWLENIY